MKSVYYDKPFYLAIVIDISNLNKQDQDNIAEFLTVKYNAIEMTYPSDFAKETAEELSQKGYLTFKKPFPYQLNSDECKVLFSKTLEKFNVHARLTVTPDTTRIKKTINDAKDYVRIVDEMNGQQDGIGMSNIWLLGQAKSQVAFSRHDHFLNARVARQVIKMPAEYIGKKKFEEKTNELIAAIDSALVSAKVVADSNRTEGKYQFV